MPTVASRLSLVIYDCTAKFLGQISSSSLIQQYKTHHQPGWNILQSSGGAGVESTICLVVSTRPKSWLWTQQKLSILHFTSRAWLWKGSAAQNSWLSTSERLSCGTQHHTPGQGGSVEDALPYTIADTHTYIYTILTIFYWRTIESILMSCMITGRKMCGEVGWRGHQDLTPLLGNVFQG